MPPLQSVIYVENNVGLGFVRAFNEFSRNHGWGAVFQHHVHPGMQRAQRGEHTGCMRTAIRIQARHPTVPGDAHQPISGQQQPGFG